MCSPVFGNCPGCNSHDHSPYKEAATTGPPIRVELCDDVNNDPGTVPFPHWTTDLKLYEMIPSGQLCAGCDEKPEKVAARENTKKKGRNETREEAELRFRAERDRDNERRKKKRREKKASQGQLHA